MTRDTILLAAMTVLAAAAAGGLVRAILGPRLMDRMVAVNFCSTLVTALLALLSLYLRADYLLDVALIYAMLSFLGSVILTRIFVIRRHSQQEFERQVLEDLKQEEEQT